MDVTSLNDHKVYETLYGLKKKTKTPKYHFKIGDVVRISKYKYIFEKGYKPNWTEEVFTITQRIARQPPVYRIKDSQETVLDGTFYEEELQKVEKPELYILEDILEHRVNNNVPEILVSWRGYPKEANSWIPAASVENIWNLFCWSLSVLYVL